MSLLQVTNGYFGLSQACMGDGIILFNGKGLQFTQVIRRKNSYEIGHYF